MFPSACRVILSDGAVIVSTEEDVVVGLES
jgi:hypothetical protein